MERDKYSLRDDVNKIKEDINELKLNFEKNKSVIVYQKQNNSISIDEISILQNIIYKLSGKNIHFCDGCKNFSSEKFPIECKFQDEIKNICLNCYNKIFD
jgi:hypothetical protein